MEDSFQASVRIRNNGIAPASWWFITVPQNISDKIKEETAAQPRKGRGSVKVQVMIGFIKRETSIFPDKKSGCYLLPIKATIRKDLNIKENTELYVTIQIHDAE